MSVGNLKDTGNLGNNFPYQLRNLQILGSIDAGIASLVSTSGGAGVGPMLYDAFGRERVSVPYTLGDYKHIYGLDQSFIDNTGNGGTVTFVPNEAAATLTTSNNPASYAIHQTKAYHQYMPGKSQYILNTFVFKSAVTNVVKRTGYFDDNNGIYFEQAGNGTLSFCVRTFTSGVVSDASKVAQANWNIDKCNGTGPSGFNLDITTTQIFFIDFQWLGVGRVRCGFVHNGAFVVAHEFYHSNILNVVYMSTPNLPVRCEIRNTGATTGGSYNQICSSVQSEGGYAEAGYDFAINNTTLRSLASSGATQTLPILAIRLKNTFQTYANRMIVRLQQYTTLSTNQPLNIKLVKLPNAASFTTGSAWVDANTAYSGVEYNVGGTAYANEEILDATYCSASQAAKGSLTANISPTTSKKNYIVQNYSSTNSEIYAIIATNIGNNSTDVGVGIQWREIY